MIPDLVDPAAGARRDIRRQTAGIEFCDSLDFKRPTGAIFDVPHDEHAIAVRVSDGKIHLDPAVTSHPDLLPELAPGNPGPRAAIAQRAEGMCPAPMVLRIGYGRHRDRF